MQTFLFYDIETSGLNPAFDQVLTFAAIRTDLNLNELDRETVSIRLRKDIVPSPGAFLTHGLTYKELSQGICEYEAAKKIHSLFNTPGTISLGYNSLGFDDEFLRFLFYRNLLDPYSHQYANGCGRMDILPVAVIFRVFHPGDIRWPSVEGRPSMKLELISSENRFETSGRAHEAMSDVEALVALSKCFIRQNQIWNYCLDFFSKARDEVRINTIGTRIKIANHLYPLCLLASASFGPDLNYLAPAIPIGPSSAFKNQSLWLRLDSDDILGLETGIEIEETFVVRKRYGDIPVVLPALDRFKEKLPDRIRATVNRNKTLLDKNQTRLKAYIAYHQAFRYPIVPDVDIDAALYQDGFFSSAEKKESRLVHQALSEGNPSVLNRIESSRVQRLAQRIVHRNFPDITTELTGSDYHQHLKRLSGQEGSGPVLGYRGDTKFNKSKAMEELDTIRAGFKKPNPAQSAMLKWLDQYLKDNF